MTITAGTHLNRYETPFGGNGWGLKFFDYDNDGPINTYIKVKEGEGVIQNANAATQKSNSTLA